MTPAIRALVALDRDVNHEMVRATLPADSMIQVVGMVDGLEESWRILQETPADVVLVACSGYSERALLFVDGAVRENASRPVIVLCEGSPNGFLRRIFEAGAHDVIRMPESPSDVLFALQKAMVRAETPTSGVGIALAPLVCVLGPKGGTGKTLTASNLAVGLATAGKTVALVDLDLQFGDVGLSLGLRPERTLSDLARSGGSIDAEKLDAYYAKHPSGVRVLLAPTRPDHAGLVTVEFLRDLYAVLRSTNDFVIVDTPPGFTPEVIASIDSSTDVCMVAMLDALSLKNTKLGLETLELMGYSRDRIRIVLNRADSRVGISTDDVAAVIGRDPDVLVPSDRDVPRAVNEGIPVVLAKPDSPAARPFKALASAYLSEDGPGVDGHVASDGAGRRRLLRRRG